MQSNRLSKHVGRGPPGELSCNVCKRYRSSQPNLRQEPSTPEELSIASP
jgi:hypothetical protein